MPGMARKMSLQPIDYQILSAGLDLAVRGEPTIHGFGISKQIAGGQRKTALIGHGTIYKALARLEQLGYLKGSWEDPQLAADEGRPRRRLYELTTRGVAEASRAPVKLAGQAELSPT